MDKDNKLIWEGYEDQQERWNKARKLKTAINNNLSVDKIVGYYADVIDAGIDIDFLEDIIQDAVRDKKISHKDGRDIIDMGKAIKSGAIKSKSYIPEDLDDDKAHSRAGLAPFSNKHEAGGWTGEETIDAHSSLVLAIAADFMGEELSHHKVNRYDDIHSDLRDDVSGWVVHVLQQDGKLPRRLDYNEHADELQEIKSAIDSFLDGHFDELRDKYEDSKDVTTIPDSGQDDIDTLGRDINKPSI